MVFRVLRRFTLCSAAVTLAACGTGDTSFSGDPESTSISSAALSAQSAASQTDIAQIRQIEDHRLLGDAQLAAFLTSGNPAARAAAATAVGRIGDPSMQTSVATLLGDGSPEVRQAAAFALGLLAGSAAEAALDARFALESDAATKRAILQALAQVGSVTSVPLVTGALAGQPAIVQGSAAEAYGTMIGNGVAPSPDASVVTEIVALAGQAPEARSIQAAYALSQLVSAGVTFDEAALTAAFHAATAPTARAYLTGPIAALGTTTSLATVAAASSSDADERVRAQACSALATAGSSATVLAALGEALSDPSHAVVVASATAIGTLGTAAASLAPKLESTLASSSSAWVRSAVVPALVDIIPASARTYVVAALSDAWPVQLAALGALPAVATAADVPTLLDLAAGTDRRLGFAAIEAISALPAALITAHVKPAMVAVLARGDWELTVGVSDVAAAFDWTDFAARLSAAYPHFTGDVAMNARFEIVWALGTIGTAAELPLLQAAIDDDTVLVSQQAAASYQKISGVDVSSQVRKENVVTTATPGPEAVARALASVVVLETTRGPIGIAMLPEAPLNVVNFVSLAARGFYDGLPFHRVLPNFVEQGGDPRGDGMGGSAHMVRDELSRDPHLGGTVGLATEGKDTGSSQFFFNEGWNVNLDERYTVFGRVVFGLEAAESLEVGDTIESVAVVSEGLAREASTPTGGM